MILTNREVAKFVENNPEINWFFRKHMSEYENKEFEWWQMCRAEYCIERGFHLWLLMNNYTHFTSPIRRIIDYLLHISIINFLDEDEQFITKKDSFDLVNYINTTLGNIDQAVLEKSKNDWKIKESRGEMKFHKKLCHFS